jgi:hypothetical protein
MSAITGGNSRDADCRTSFDNPVMPSRLVAIVIDSVDPRPVADFWCAVLDWK